MDAGLIKRLFKYNCYRISHSKLSEKVTVFKKYLLMKKFLFWKSNGLEEVSAWKKDMSQ